MRPLSLSEIGKILGIKQNNYESVMIKEVVTSLKEMGHNKLIFYLDKLEELDTIKLKKLKHCFVITDQPLLKEYQHLRGHFLFVSDVMKAYDTFIEYYRASLDLTTVAITGTCGKTTTKEMIKQVLEHDYHVSGTISSKNNLRWNHHYLMALDDTTDFGIYETALTDPGNIIYSAKFFRPSIGVITNIGIDHLSGCKTLEKYILAKGEMLAALDYEGTLIINSDDENINKIDLTSFRGTILTTGINDQADYVAKEIQYGKSKMYFILEHKDREYKVRVPGLGVHNVYNALSALAVLDTLGMQLERAIGYLLKYQPIDAHFQVHKGIHNSLIIDDTWSSNPTSIKAAFETLSTEKKIKIAVLGNISYLGDYVLEQCREIGKMVVEYNIDYLVTIDQFSKQIGKEAIRYGMNKDHVFNCKNADELRKTLLDLIQPKTLVLVKTSMFDRRTKTIIKEIIEDE